jgi:hypothetical protein
LPSYYIVASVIILKNGIEGDGEFSGANDCVLLIEFFVYPRGVGYKILCRERNEGV